jgi:hypothetical protein
MSLLSAGSISLDSTFNIKKHYCQCFEIELMIIDFINAALLNVVGNEIPGGWHMLGIMPQINCKAL